MEIKYRTRVSYRLNPFTYCKLLNDRVYCAGLTRSFGMDNSYKHCEKPKCVQENIIEHKIENIPCSKPILAIRKWKYWKYKPSYIYNQRNCFKCTDNFTPSYFIPKPIDVINGLYVFQKIVSVINRKYI